MGMGVAMLRDSREAPNPKSARGPGVGAALASRFPGRHCPLMLLPGSGAACSGFGTKGDGFAPAGIGGKRGIIWGMPRSQRRCQTLHPWRAWCCSLTQELLWCLLYLKWAFLSGSKLLPKFAVKELQVRNLAPGLYL